MSDDGLHRNALRSQRRFLWSLIRSKRPPHTSKPTTVTPAHQPDMNVRNAFAHRQWHSIANADTQNPCQFSTSHSYDDAWLAEAYRKWMVDHGFDPAANWQVVRLLSMHPAVLRAVVPVATSPDRCAKAQCSFLIEGCRDTRALGSPQQSRSRSSVASSRKPILTSWQTARRRSMMTMQASGKPRMMPCR